MADDTTPNDLPDGEEAEDDDTPDEGTVITGGRVEPVILRDEMKSSYLDYAMSVIVGRALPDVRDGLKPVHRRILYSMFESGLRPDRPYRKCASAVGEVMKKYHPHGDSSIYDALVRMAQDFSIRYLLVDGHGNFGSVDGDPPAAMRYTEARMSKLSLEMLRDIDQETVDFRPNYDGYEEEPTVLPARFPNLLVNGSTGIAVGMATNIPPHNLTEIIDATIALIDNPELTAVDLMQWVKGPDFPTGGLILGNQGAYDAYTTGRGSIRVRSVAEIEEDEKGGMRIVVTEIPYMVNKSNLLLKIASHVNNRTIEGIRDLRDHSSRDGMRIVIELKRGANAQVVLNLLYKHTQLQDTFGVNLLAIVDGVPKTLRLDQALQHYIDHQINVITRRTTYRLRKAQERAHVLEGLMIALDHIDAIIALIRGSASADAAKSDLMEQFSLSEIQAQAILDMQLRRLAALERQRIIDEYEDLKAIIDELKDILAKPERVRTIVKEELTAVQNAYGDERRSKIIADDGSMTVEDLIPEGNIVVTLTQAGYLKRTPQAAFTAQHRGGRGVRGAAMKSDDIVRDLITCSTHDFLLVFTNKGRVYRIKAYQIPERGRAAKGVYVSNVPGLALEADEAIAAVLSLREFDEDRFAIFATKMGRVKRTSLDAFDSPRSVLIAINLNEGDELIGVELTSGQDDVILVSKAGKAIRFDEHNARAMGRSAAGVKGMKLSTKFEGDEVLSMVVVPFRDWLMERLPNGDPKLNDKGEPTYILDDDGKKQRDFVNDYLMVVTEDGYGKRTPLVQYPRKTRGTQGVLTMKMKDDRGGLVGALRVEDETGVLLVTNNGTVIRIRVTYDNFRPMSRSTQGVRLMKPRQGAEVVAIAKIIDADDEDGLDEENLTEGDESAAPQGPPPIADQADELTDDADE